MSIPDLVYKTIFQFNKIGNLGAFGGGYGTKGYDTQKPFIGRRTDVQTDEGRTTASFPHKLEKVR